MECQCLCHQDDTIVHFVACCSKCYYCGKNIPTQYLETHMEECNEDNERTTKNDN